MGKEEKSIFWNMMSLYGILLVVAGHSLLAPTHPNYTILVKGIHTWIYSFHMPLFAFISGACFIEYSIKHYSLLNFFKDKIKRLLLPYCLWIVLVAVLSVLFSFTAIHDRNLSFEYVLLCLLFPVKYSVVSYYWFLITLFWIFMIAVIIKNGIYNEVYVIAITFILIVLNIVNPFSNIEVLCLYKVFDLLLYFWLGMLAAVWGVKKIICENPCVIFGLLVASVLGSVVMFPFPAVMKILMPSIGILSSLHIVRYFQMKGICLSCRVSYTIYLLHGLAQKIPYILLKNAKLFWWEHLIIYTILGMAIPIIVAYIWKNIHIKSYKLFLGQ